MDDTLSLAGPGPMEPVERYVSDFGDFEARRVSHQRRTEPSNDAAPSGTVTFRQAF